MFKKYMTKLTNTVNTVNYLNKLTKDKEQQDPRYTRNVLILDLSAAADVEQLLEPMTPELEETHTILSAAIADLRNTLLFYPLVLFRFFVSFSVENWSILFY